MGPSGKYSGALGASTGCASRSRAAVGDGELRALPRGGARTGFVPPPLRPAVGSEPRAPPTPVKPHAPCSPVSCRGGCSLRPVCEPRRWKHVLVWEREEP